MKPAVDRGQNEEREKKKRDAVTGNVGKFKQVYDKTTNIKDKYDNIKSARNITQNRYRWLQNGEVHPTTYTATQSLSLQTTANALPQKATILGA